MNNLRGFIGCLTLVMSFSLFAEEGPSLIQNETFDMQKCLTDTADECISTVCIKSEHRDCQDNCRHLAEAQCKEKELAK